jgi:hypothetical protein
MLYHQSKMNIFFSKFYDSSSVFLSDDGLGFFFLFSRLPKDMIDLLPEMK